VPQVSIAQISTFWCIKDANTQTLFLERKTLLKWGKGDGVGTGTPESPLFDKDKEAVAPIWA